MYITRRSNVPCVLSCIFIIALFIYTIYFVSTVNSGSKTWVLLVSGSKSYMNYRHQADICHAYHLFRDNGIPPERIVVMMYDDIAHSTLNPTPGVIINVPNGPNVYQNVPIHFSGDDVNVENFVNVLLGNEDQVKFTETSEVMSSGPDDNIFIKFVDHGGPGFLGFPNELLHAVDFDALLSRMVEKRKFSKMVLFIEASYSGSFDQILRDYNNVYVISSSDAKEPSSACYYDMTRHTYLADVFSVNWMKHIERDLSGTLSLHSLYQRIRSDTEQSHVEDYGDLNVGTTKVSDFVGFQRKSETFQAYGKPSVDAIANPSVPVALIEQKLHLTTDIDKRNTFKDQMKSLFQKRSLVDQVMQKIVYEVVEDGSPTQVDIIQNYNFPVTKSNMHCIRKVIDEFSAYCFNINENLYVRTAAIALVNMCSVDFTSPEDIVHSIRTVCLGLTKDIKDIY